MSLQLKNIQHSTSNVQHPNDWGAGKLGSSVLNACSRDSGVRYSMFVRKIPLTFRLLAKRRRAAALQDAARGTMIPEIREASWTAPALWRFPRGISNCANVNWNCSTVAAGILPPRWLVTNRPPPIKSLL